MSASKTEHSLLPAVVQAIGGSVFVLDEQGHYLEIVGDPLPNHGEGDALRGKHVSEVLPDFVAELLAESARKARDGGQTETVEYRLGDGADQGSERWFEARMVPLASEPGAVAWVAQEITRRKHMERELEAVTLIDPITEVSNQRHFMRVLDHEIVRQRRYREPFCMLMLEVDHFDTIRENFGEEAATACLQETARLIRQQLRHSDVMARLEDAGFGVLLLNTPLHWAREVAERIRARIARTPISIAKRTLRLTVSGGVTDLRSGDTASSLLWRTEEALFKSENSGQSSINVT